MAVNQVRADRAWTMVIGMDGMIGILRNLLDPKIDGTSVFFFTIISLITEVGNGYCSNFAR